MIGRFLGMFPKGNLLCQLAKYIETALRGGQAGFTNWGLNIFLLIEKEETKDYSLFFGSEKNRKSQVE